MKIIGWYRKGNVVRLALGNDDLEYWEGDDWDNSPYEHNGDSIPLFGVEAEIDIAFKYDTSVLEAAGDYHYKGNSPFSLNDFRYRKAPILIIDPTGSERYYSKCQNKDVFKLYMGDKFEDIDWENLGIIGMYYVRGDSSFSKCLKSTSANDVTQKTPVNTTTVSRMDAFGSEHHKNSIDTLKKYLDTYSMNAPIIIDKTNYTEEQFNLFTKALGCPNAKERIVVFASNVKSV